MLRALLWKEWRSQRQIAAAGVALALVVPAFVLAIAWSSGSPNYRMDTADLIPFLMAGFVWPLFAALTGAASNPAEANAESLGFLFSRPVPRYRVWSAKVAVAIAGLAMVIASSLVVVNAIQAWAGLGWTRFPFFMRPLFGVAVLRPDGVRATALGFVLLAFALSVFFAMFTRRQLAAAAAGVLSAVIAVVVVVFVMARFSADPQGTTGSEAFLSSIFLLTTAAVLLGSLYFFVAGGALDGVDRRRAGAVTAAGILVVFAGGSVVSASASTRIDPETARFTMSRAVASGGYFLVRAGHSDFGGAAYFIATPGEPLRRLTERLTEGAEVSPTGEWIVYRDHRGLFGLRRDDCDLRAVRSDGSDDYLIERLSPCSPFVLFSGDGSRIAYGPIPLGAGPAPSGLGLTIASLEGDRDRRTLRFADADVSGGRAYRWIDGDSRILITRPALSVLDVATGEVTQLQGGDQAPRFRLYGVYGTRLLVLQRAGVGRIVAAGSGSATITRSSAAEVSERFLWVDTSDGTAEELAGPCPDPESYIRLSVEGSVIYYAGCGEGEPRNELWTLHLETGERVLRATLDGDVVSTLPSPGQERLWVRAVFPSDESRRGYVERDFIVEPGGAIRELVWPRPWRLYRVWWDDHRMVVYQGSSRSGQEYALYDVETGLVQSIVGEASTP